MLYDDSFSSILSFATASFCFSTNSRTSLC